MIADSFQRRPDSSALSWIDRAAIAAHDASGATVVWAYLDEAERDRWRRIVQAVVDVP
jgi:hypothetical protein